MNPMQIKMPIKEIHGVHRKSIADSILYSIIERPQEKVIRKYKENFIKKFLEPTPNEVHFDKKIEEYWKKRGLTPIEANMDLLSSEELS